MNWLSHSLLVSFSNPHVQWPINVLCRTHVSTSLCQGTRYARSTGLCSHLFGLPRVNYFMRYWTCHLLWLRFLLPSPKSLAMWASKLRKHGDGILRKIYALSRVVQRTVSVRQVDHSRTVTSCIWLHWRTHLGKSFHDQVDPEFIFLNGSGRCSVNNKPSITRA